MSLHGTVVLWTPTPPADVPRALKHALDLIGAPHIAFAARYAVPPQEWRKLRREIDEGITEPEDDFQLLGRGLPVSEVPALWLPNSSLSIQFGATPLGAEIMHDIERHVPHGVRGEFQPCDPILAVGGHDLLSDSDNQDGVEFLGRAEFSLKIFGYGLPEDAARYRASVFSAPRLQQLKADLEREVGPLREGATWSW